MLNKIYNHFFSHGRNLTQYERDLQEYEEDLKAARREGAWEHIERARQEYIHKAFEIKRDHDEFRLPPEAQKVYNNALRITEAALHDRILDYGRDYAFLVDSRHFFHKHIITLNERWHANDKQSSLIQEIEGRLIVQTYGTGRNTHIIEELRERALANQELTYNLDYFALNVERPDDVIDHLEPKFKDTGDGNFYLDILTDCPKSTINIKGNHTWLRPVDDQGIVYSNGKFRKIERLLHIFEKVPVEYKNADKHEWLMRDDTIRVHRLRLRDRASFERIVQKIENDFQNVADQFFLFFGDNCSDWALEVIDTEFDLSGINKRRMQVDGLEILIPRVWKIYTHNTPDCIKRLLDPLRKLVSKLIFQVPRFVMIVLLGGLRRHGEAAPYVRTAGLFGPITNVTHPYKLRRWLDENLETLQDLRRDL